MYKIKHAIVVNKENFCFEVLTCNPIYITDMGNEDEE